MPSATVRTTWTVCSPAAARSVSGVECLAGELDPAQREVRGDIRHRGAVQARAHVVPAEPAAGGVALGVVAVTAEVGHVDAPDERRVPVDDHDLLVVAVDRVLTRVDLAADLRLAGQLLDIRRHLRARGMEERDRGARPHEHAHVGALGDLGQERTEDDGALPAHQLEVRGDVPAHDVHRVPPPRRSRTRSRPSPPRRRSSTSSRQPSRGGGPPAAHSASPSGSSACARCSRRSRQTCLRLTAASTASPTAASSRSIEGRRMLTVPGFPIAAPRTHGAPHTRRAGAGPQPVIPPPAANTSRV